MTVPIAEGRRALGRHAVNEGGRGIQLPQDKELKSGRADRLARRGKPRNKVIVEQALRPSSQRK